MSLWGSEKDDYEYNARKKAEAEEIDHILEKVRKFRIHKFDRGRKT